ncbi:MAG: hypothetical protein RLZZ274_628 [Cyanobacteriota bacterium]
MAASQVSREPDRGEGVIPQEINLIGGIPCQEVLSLCQQSEEVHYQVTGQIQVAEQIVERAYEPLILKRS